MLMKIWLLKASVKVCEWTLSEDHFLNYNFHLQPGTFIKLHATVLSQV